MNLPPLIAVLHDAAFSSEIWKTQYGGGVSARSYSCGILSTLGNPKLYAIRGISQILKTL